MPYIYKPNKMKPAKVEKHIVKPPELHPDSGRGPDPLNDGAGLDGGNPGPDGGNDLVEAGIRPVEPDRPDEDGKHRKRKRRDIHRDVSTGVSSKQDFCFVFVSCYAGLFCWGNSWGAAR